MMGCKMKLEALEHRPAMLQSDAARQGRTVRVGWMLVAGQWRPTIHQEEPKRIRFTTTMVRSEA
jgi:hypothetical protein